MLDTVLIINYDDDGDDNGDMSDNCDENDGDI